MKHPVVVLVLIAAAAAAGGHVQVASIGVADAVYEVAIASDKNAWRRGLQDQPPLKADEGMLFAFPDEIELTFWMAGVDFPLDIAFFDRCGQLVDFLENLPPCTTFSLLCPRYTSDRPAQYALEINAGDIQTQRLKIGDQLTGLPFPNCL